MAKKKKKQEITTPALYALKAQNLDLGPTFSQTRRKHRRILKHEEKHSSYRGYCMWYVHYLM